MHTNNKFKQIPNNPNKLILDIFPIIISYI